MHLAGEGEESWRSRGRCRSLLQSGGLGRRAVCTSGGRHLCLDLCESIQLALGVIRPRVPGGRARAAAALDDGPPLHVLLYCKSRASGGETGGACVYKSAPGDAASRCRSDQTPARATEALGHATAPASSHSRLIPGPISAQSRSTFASESSSETEPLCSIAGMWSV